MHNRVFCSCCTRSAAIFQTVYHISSDYTEPPHGRSVSVLGDIRSGVTEAVMGPLICTSFQRAFAFGWGRTWRRQSKILWLVINSVPLMFGHLSATFLFWRRTCLFEVGFFCWVFFFFRNIWEWSSGGLLTHLCIKWNANRYLKGIAIIASQTELRWHHSLREHILELLQFHWPLTPQFYFFIFNKTNDVRVCSSPLSVPPPLPCLSFPSFLTHQDPPTPPKKILISPVLLKVSPC